VKLGVLPLAHPNPARASVHGRVRARLVCVRFMQCDYKTCGGDCRPRTVPDIEVSCRDPCTALRRTTWLRVLILRTRTCAMPLFGCDRLSRRGVFLLGLGVSTDRRRRPLYRRQDVVLHLLGGYRRDPLLCTMARPFVDPLRHR